MDFVSRKKSSSEVDIPETVSKEIEDSFLQEIVFLVEEFHIPTQFISSSLNQTPAKYVSVSVGNQAMTEKGSSDATMLGYHNKKLHYCHLRFIRQG